MIRLIFGVLAVAGLVGQILVMSQLRRLGHRVRRLSLKAGVDPGAGINDLPKDG